MLLHGMRGRDHFYVVKIIQMNTIFCMMCAVSTAQIIGSESSKERITNMIGGEQNWILPGGGELVVGTLVKQNAASLSILMNQSLVLKPSRMAV